MLKYLLILFMVTCTSAAIADSALDCNQNRTNELTCMKCNIYHEARGLSKEEQLLVGLTTIERVRSSTYPNTVCEVVWQPSQFSWTNDGRTDKIHEKDSWKNVSNIASLVMMDLEDDFVTVLPANVNEKQLKGMMWYHAKTVNPRWAKAKTIIFKKSGHIYYKK